MMLIFTDEALVAYNCKNACVSVFSVFLTAAVSNFVSFESNRLKQNKELKLVSNVSMKFYGEKLFDILKIQDDT